MRLQDPLVHVCLYFVAPHRLKHMDIAFMRALHRKVNIVPIIAKSDTMTTKEKEYYSPCRATEIFSQLLNHRMTMV